MLPQGCIILQCQEIENRNETNQICLGGTTIITLDIQKSGGFFQQAFFDKTILF